MSRTFAHKPFKFTPSGKLTQTIRDTRGDRTFLEAWLTWDDPLGQWRIDAKHFGSAPCVKEYARQFNRSERHATKIILGSGGGYERINPRGSSRRSAYYYAD